uniref:Ionotropic glutamate receptor C-terminal domain-containing protein n=1 Tax=Chromera velia CCMP2878 TaxID=1169474 RepID=A0A0G4GZX1_9ALVE|eukprot:Cvel_5484.t1-p1 / transcript=Cvel_5484.t1 / gene=Cvel_5484 / organism=Chromera_velia_CCMP2878 / gene_product=Glutamate receptor 2, putative / transcript_product=Glutamate receptor 2, putative / location=Cvel_scaffold256:95875-98358(+) / protein_length=684 / sequence_SO=supercontig / SO=protein_coding / is_pseudo=false
MSGALLVSLSFLFVKLVRGYECQVGGFENTTLTITFLPNPREVYWEPSSEQTTNPGNAKGYLVDLYKEIFETLSLSYTVTTGPTDEALELHGPSKFTATTYDVGVGNFDMSISGFYESLERRTLTDFVSPVGEDLMYVATSRLSKSFTGESVTNAFRPFTFTVWLAVLGMTVVSSFLYLFLEYSMNDEDFEQKQTKRNLLLRNPCRAMYLTWRSLFSASAEHSPVGFAGRLMTLGFGFFVLVILSSYTANLASILTTQRTSGRVNSITDIEENRLTLCVQSATISTFAALYPRVKTTTGVGWVKLLEMYDNNECQAILFSDRAFDELQYGAWGDTRCNMIKVGEPLFGYSLSQPISPDSAMDGLDRAISCHIVKKKLNGRLKELKERHAGNNNCALTDEDLPAEEDQLDLIDLGGTFVLTAVIYLAAILIKFCQGENGNFTDCMKRSDVARTVRSVLRRPKSAACDGDRKELCYAGGGRGEEGQDVEIGSNRTFRSRDNYRAGVTFHEPSPGGRGDPGFRLGLDEETFREVLRNELRLHLNGNTIPSQVPEQGRVKDETVSHMQQIPMNSPTHLAASHMQKHGHVPCESGRPSADPLQIPPGEDRDGGLLQTSAKHRVQQSAEKSTFENEIDQFFEVAGPPAEPVSAAHRRLDVSGEDWDRVGRGEQDEIPEDEGEDDRASPWS